MSAETEYVIGEVHHLLMLRVHPLVIAEQLNRKPVTVYKILLTHGDPAAELFASFRGAPQTYTREQKDRRLAQARRKRVAA